MNSTDLSSTSNPHAKLRKFGLTMFIAFAVLSLLFFLRGKTLWHYSSGLSAFFLLAALAFPGALSGVEKVWMKFAGVLGFIMTNVLLTLVFFIGVTPTGLLMRLLGKDPIEKGFDGKKSSYWVDVEEDGPCGRPEKPY